LTDHPGKAAGVLAPAWPSELGAAIWDACVSCLVLVDQAGMIAAVNQAFAGLVGPAPGALLGRPAWELLPMEVGLAALAAIQAPCHGQATTARLPVVPEQIIVDPLGNRRRIAWSLGLVVSQRSGTAHLLVTGVDLTRERTLQATLRERADSDSLTGLANREFLHRALTSCLDPFRGAGASLLFCDLDGFKQINDTHGHHVGDQVLQEVARRLTRTCRPEDLVARIGGDEFVILVPAGGSFDARAMTARLERAINRPMDLNGTRLRVGVSIGARVADPGEDPESVSTDADAAMYQAKRRRQAS
jgi:diguanylate cyclase (GGDEF)-like protein